MPKFEISFHGEIDNKKASAIAFAINKANISGITPKGQDVDANDVVCAIEDGYHRGDFEYSSYLSLSKDIFPVLKESGVKFAVFAKDSGFTVVYDGGNQYTSQAIGLLMPVVGADVLRDIIAGDVDEEVDDIVKNAIGLLNAIGLFEKPYLKNEQK